MQPQWPLLFTGCQSPTCDTRRSMVSFPYEAHVWNTCGPLALWAETMPKYSYGLETVPYFAGSDVKFIGKRSALSCVLQKHVFSRHLKLPVVCATSCPASGSERKSFSSAPLSSKFSGVPICYNYATNANLTPTVTNRKGVSSCFSKKKTSTTHCTTV